MQVIRKRAVVYVGLDALSDAEVAAAVGNSMFSDLVSVAGHIYKFGIDDGLPGAATGMKVPINVHADEFNELMGDEFIPMVNKGGGAGVQVTAYTQTRRHRGPHRQPCQGRSGHRQLQQPVHAARARDRHGRTADAATAQGRGYATAVMSGATDSSDPTGNTAFTSTRRTASAATACR